jgi:hypothetical protein
MRTSDMIKSKYWRARDVEGKPPIVLTIADVSEELMARGGGHKETKCFLWFTENLKGLQLNKSRVTVLEAAYGPDSAYWVGRKVRLSFDPTVEFGGRPVGGVKIETERGVIYRPTATETGWGEPSGRAAAPPGAPPPPVWDEKRQTWVNQAPIAAPRPSQPPPPVWNEATGKWDVVNPSTGEIHHPMDVKDPMMGGAPTISQRVNAEHPAGAHADFNDDIPF